MWYVSMLFKVICILDQMDEEDEDAPKMPQQ